MPATMLVFAHPDDETVALGARLARFAHGQFIQVTDGAPRNQQDSRWHGFASWGDYRGARAEELANVLSSAGIPPTAHRCLDVPDQEASLHLAQLSARIAELIAQYQPEVIFTHPYEGGHPDHDACAFAVHHAVRMLRQKESALPVILECAFYSAGAEPGNFLPAGEEIPRAEYSLSPEERDRKQARINFFKTQDETLRSFPLDCERFRLAPAYDFRVQPHSPPLLYDRYPWGMTSGRFSQLAVEAEELLYEQR